MITGQLIARRVNNDPPNYRIIFDDVEVGSISRRAQHAEPMASCWHWGVDTMPLVGGGTEPNGDETTFGEALEAFRIGFFTWVNQLAPGVWAQNHDHKKTVSARWRL